MADEPIEDEEARKLAALGRGSGFIVMGRDQPTSRRRCYAFDEQLRLSGRRSRLGSLEHPELRTAVLGCRVLVLHAAEPSRRLSQLVAEIRDSGGVAVADMSPALEAECDAVLTVSGARARKLQSRGIVAWPAPQVLDLELLRRCQRVRDAAVVRPVTTMAAAPADRQLVAVSVPTDARRAHLVAFRAQLLRALTANPALMIAVIGPGHALLSESLPAERLATRAWSRWADVPALLARSQAHVLLDPGDTELSEADAQLAWLMACACDLTTSASDGPWARRFKSAHEGALATVGESEWAAAIEAVDGAEGRAPGDAAVGRTARREAVRRHTTPGCAGSFVEGLDRAFATRRKQGDRARPWRAASIARPSADGLRVAMLVPEPFPGSGGHTTALRMASGLARAGHDVTVYVDWGPWFANASESELARFLEVHFPVFGLRVRRGREIAPADAAIATYWGTAGAVAATPNAGARLYFVQDYEPDFHPRDERVLLAEATYRLGLDHITIGPWLAGVLRERFNARATHIGFGVNHELFAPGPPPEKDRVCFYARPTTARRGTGLGLAALAQIKEVRPDVEVVLYGSPEPIPVPFEHRNVGVVSPEELALLYRSSSVGLVLSYTNLSLVPLEMMASGCPVVAVDVEPVRWLLRHGHNAMLGAPTADSLAESTLRLLEDPTLRQTIADQARVDVAGFTWEESQHQFELAVRDAVERGSGLTSPQARLSTQTSSPFVLDELADAGKAGQALQAGRPIGRYIDCTADGLCRIDFRFELDGGAPTRGSLVLSVREHETAPENLAATSVEARDLVDGAWQPFTFPPLSETSGRRLYISLEARDLADVEQDEVRVITGPGETDADGQAPAFRTYCCRDLRVACGEPFLRGWMREREQARAELRLARAATERRGVGKLVRLWLRFTRPLPPERSRPWRSDWPLARKLAWALRLYGPLTLTGEAGLRARRALAGALETLAASRTDSGE